MPACFWQERCRTAALRRELLAGKDPALPPACTSTLLSLLPRPGSPHQASSRPPDTLSSETVSPWRPIQIHQNSHTPRTPPKPRCSSPEAESGAPGSGPTCWASALAPPLGPTAVITSARPGLRCGGRDAGSAGLHCEWVHYRTKYTEEDAFVETTGGILETVAGHSLIKKINSPKLHSTEQTASRNATEGWV